MNILKRRLQNGAVLIHSSIVYLHHFLYRTIYRLTPEHSRFNHWNQFTQV